MFKIESITINNFKNIVDTELPLGDFNVVVGPNNSGKSNFLQVIPFLRWLINGDVKEVEESLREGFFPGLTNYIKNEYNDEHNLKVDIEYSNVKTGNVFFYQIQLKADPNGTGVDFLKIVNESLHYKNKSSRGKAIRIFEQKDYKVEFGKEFFSTKIIEQVPSHVSVLRHLNLIANTQAGPLDYKEAINGLDEVLNPPIYFFSSSELRKEANEKPQTTLRFRSIYTNIESNIAVLKKSMDWETLISIIKKTINVSDIEVPGDIKDGVTIQTVFFNQAGTDKLVEELSDGSLMILSLITEVLTTKSPLILIEEPENSLHPKALSELIRFLQSRTDKQFILTTHSPALLNLVKPEEVIVARLDEKGNSRLEKIKDLKELKRKLNKGYVTFGDLLIDNIDEGEDGEEKEYKRAKIIFLYEGDTEKEFYDLIFEKKLPKGSRLLFIPLCGFIKTNNKGVAHELDKYLWNRKYRDEECIHVFIAYDREGPIDTELRINIELLRRDFCGDDSRIKSINQIIATQDLESWLFLDIDGIYTFLKTQKSKRAPHKYKSQQSFNNKHLSALFYQNENQYRKGEMVAGFIEKLDLEKIYNNCAELRTGIELLISKCG